ncbi:hypothetical protein STANM309S_01011 [Streptomyces tanashiensis]
MEVRKTEIRDVVTHLFMLSARRGRGNSYVYADRAGSVAQDTYETVSFR